MTISSQDGSAGLPQGGSASSPQGGGANEAGVVQEEAASSSDKVENRGGEENEGGNIFSNNSEDSPRMATNQITNGNEEKAYVEFFGFGIAEEFFRDKKINNLQLRLSLAAKARETDAKIKRETDAKSASEQIKNPAKSEALIGLNSETIKPDLTSNNSLANIENLSSPNIENIGTNVNDLNIQKFKDFNENEKILIEYFYDGQWQTAGEINLASSEFGNSDTRIDADINTDKRGYPRISAINKNPRQSAFASEASDFEISNKTNGGYFLYGLPVFDSPQKFQDFKVRISYATKFQDLNVSKFKSEVYLDSLWLEANYGHAQTDADTTQTDADKTNAKKDADKRDINELFDEYSLKFKRGTGPEGDASRPYGAGAEKISIDEAKILGEYDLDLVSAQKNFRLTENPEFKFVYQKKRGFFGTIAAFILGLFRDEYKNIEIQAGIPELKDINFDARYIGSGEFSIKIIPAENFRQIKPGKHKLKIAIKDDGEVVAISEQDFTWGVLAINTNKSIYTTHRSTQIGTQIDTDIGVNLCGEANDLCESAYIQMAVLDDLGRTICNASLKLEIRNPKSETTILTTEDGTIQYSGKCEADNVTDTPDYYAYYPVGEAGKYEMKLTNLDNGHEITDSFEVRDPSAGSGQAVPFDVERIGPTRIYPPASYEMKMKIKVNQDFEGEIIESVPAGFDISNISLNKKSAETTDSLDLTLVRESSSSPYNQYNNSESFVNNLLIKNPAKSEAFDDSQNDSIKSDLTPIDSLADKKDLSSSLSVDNLKDRGPAGNRTPENLVSNQISNHSRPTADLSYQIIDEKANSSANSEQTKIIQWDVNWKVGEEYEIKYQFDAPDISPYLYLLGPLIFVDNTLDTANINIDKTLSTTNINTKHHEENISGDSSNISGNLVFKEIRSWQIASDAPPELILFWDGGTPPSGWSCISCIAGDPFYQIFPRASDTYGSTGGASTSTHEVLFASSTGPSNTATSRTGTGITGTSNTHTHGLSSALITSSSTLPQYRNLKIIRYDNGIPDEVPNGAIGIFDSATLPANWSLYTAQNNYFLRGENSTTTGGSNTHQHTPVNATTSQASAIDLSSLGTTGGTMNLSTHIHTFSTSTGFADHKPPYIEIILAKTTATTSIPAGMYGLFNAVPPDSWDIKSNPGQDFYQKFLMGNTGTTFPTTGGSATHNHSTTTVTTGSGDTTATQRTGSTQTGVAMHPHTHNITINFEAADNLPPYREVIVARYSNWSQNYFRFYQNIDAIQPATALSSENQSAIGIKNSQVFRIRMSLRSNSTTSAEYIFKLQYATATDDCSLLGSWSDMGDIGSGAIFRGYDNASVLDGATTTANLLSVSDVRERYEEQNPATTTGFTINTDEDAEWDFVVQNNSAALNAWYCFRMLQNNGEAIGYINYPQLKTNGLPGTPTLSKLFDNEKTASTTPWFEFSASDIDSDDLHYQVQIDDDYDFGLPEIDNNSETHYSQFSNIINSSDKSPFNHGDTIRYTASTALTNNTTYWWRVRARDPNGTNQWGSWSSKRSFTVDTSVAVSTWFQTTEEQFNTDTLSGVYASTSDDVRLLTGSSTGVLTGNSIDFNWKSTGNSWGELSFNHSAAQKAVFSTATSTATWQVPAGITSITIKAWGGGGGGGAGGTAGGGGEGAGAGFSSSTIAVTEGETLNIKIGGTGGPGTFPGTSGGGGGGGGYSAVLRATTPLIIAAGGGGGGGGDNTSATEGGDGGVGGGTTGGTGASSGLAGGGVGGTQSAGGAAGTGGLNVGTNGSSLTGGLGGDGLSGAGSDGSEANGGLNGGGAGGTGNTAGYGGGAGAGAGYYGGGGGCSSASGSAGGGGGGGGSCYASSTQSGSGQNAGNNTDSDYSGSAGAGGNGGGTSAVGFAGNPGRIVINYGVGGGAGDIKYQVQYYTSTSSWELIPDSDLPGNSAGFSASPVSLLGLDTDVYQIIRLKANFTDVDGTPILYDWTLKWGQKVEKPTLSKLFDNEKTGTTTPSFEFYTTDPQSDDITYQISWSTSTSFIASTTRTSNADTGFVNIASSTDVDPFISGNTIRFTVQPADVLINGITYWWRVRAKDPNGTNVWSLWSLKRSFTIDTSVAVSTWFQTTKEQFETDYMFGSYASTSDDVRVPAIVQGAMVVYGEGTVYTPRYRIWSGSSWGGELSALTVGAPIKWVSLKANPGKGEDEYVLGTLGSDGDVNIQMYRDGVWQNLQEITNNISNTNARGFDIVYETNSARVMAVACDGDADPSYWVWDGVSWTGPNTINLSSLNNCEWIKLARDPAPGSNELIVLSRDTGSQYEAQVWNGSSWGNSRILGSMSEPAHEGMALEYEESGNQAMAAVSNGLAGSFAWSTWDGSVWSSVPPPQTIGDDLEWGILKRDRGTDNMFLCYIDHDEDIGTIQWNGSAWGTYSERDTIGNSKNGRPIDCDFETTAGRDGYLMVPYSDTTNARYQYWNGSVWSAEASISTIEDSWTIQSQRTDDDKILAVFFDDVNLRYDFSWWNGSSWSARQTLETNPSVQVSPFGQPFYLAVQQPPVQANIKSTAIDFDWGNGPYWGEFSWNDFEPGATTLKYQVLYYNTASSSWDLIPDAALPGNSSGTSTSPLNLQGLNKNIYNELKLKGTFTCDLGVCPVLYDWTLKWAEGITISGIAKQYDQTTDVTAGTVAVAVNGVLQTGKTGTIAAGVWSISNVTVYEGNVVTVFISGAADANEAVAISKYDGDGNISGMNLYERHLSVGSDDKQTIYNLDLSQYDYSVSSNEDIFFDVDASNNLTACYIGACSDIEIWVKNNNTFQPATSTAVSITTHDIEINGTSTADSNTFYISGSWDNNGIFSAGSSAVIFTATSGAESIDSTGATTTSFYNLTLGQSSGSAIFNSSSSLDIDGALAINYGTLKTNNYNINLAGNLTIGASGFYDKGTTIFTFDGSGTNTWTDNNASKQDMGGLLIDGSSKIIQASSSIKATNITIGSDDTFSGGAYNIECASNWTNNNIFTAASSTVSFTATSTGKTIEPGESAFYNVSFTGVSGGWQFTTSTTINNNLTLSAGTLSGTSSVLVKGGNTTGTGGGIINLTGGTFNLQKGGSFGGTSGWTFYNLTFGDGALATTTNKTGAGNINISSVLTISSSHTLNGGSEIWTLSGSSTPFVKTGTFMAQSSTFKYTSNSATNITSATYYQLELSPASAGSPTYTLQSAALTTNNHLYIGDSTNPVSVNASTTNPTLDIIGNFEIRTNATFIASQSAGFSVAGNWLNSGTFTHNNGTLVFDATETAKTINPGNSSFYIVSFNSASGGWTVTNNATSTNNWNLTSASNFTATSGIIIQVNGQFSNNLANASTTWTGATLYLNSGTNYSINASTTAETYGTLKIGSNTHIRMWNSAANSYDVSSSGSLYSQDHNNSNGSLYIWGNYARSSGTDYWSRATDFDGTSLTGSERQCDVRFAQNATATYSGTSVLQMLGSASATTTLDNQGSGNYAISISGTSLNAQYYKIRNINQNGLNLSGSLTVTSLNYGDFELNVNGGTMLKISSTTIDNNPAKTIYGCQFSTSTGVASGYNITAVGTSTSYFWFTQHFGNFDGEQFDQDTGDPGNIRWDDSQIVIIISGNIYSDEGANVSSVCDDSTNVVRLKVGGLGNYISSCSSSSGAYSLEITYAGNVVLTGYLDTSGGAKAVVLTKTPTENISGFDLYENRVIIKHQESEPLTITDMAVYDSDNDSDILFNAATGTPNTLIVDDEAELYIWPGKEFAPGGNIALQPSGSGDSWDGSLKIASGSIFTAAGTESHSIGGNWFASSTAVFIAASSTVSFTATSTGKTIEPGNSAFYNVSFTGVSGGWSFTTSTTINNNLTLSAGTLSGTSNITVKAGNATATGGGIINLTSGIFNLQKGGNFGGTSAWTFYNLTFGDGALSTTTNKTGAGNINVSSVLTISSSHTLNANSQIWTLSGSSTPFVKTGTFNAESSIFKYTSNQNTNITTAVYYQLELSPSSAGSPLYTINSGTLTTNNHLYIGDSTNAVTVSADANDPTLDIIADFEIRNNAAFIASNIGGFSIAGSYLNNGTFTHSNGTVVFDATSSGKTINPGNSSFYIVSFNSASGGWTITNNATSTNNWNLTSASSFTATSGITIQVNGQFSNGLSDVLTTWTGSVLYLNSGSGYTINSKTTTDTYNNLKIGANTQIRMWNSAANSYDVSSSGSLYSQDHNNANGSLYIWGNYSRSSGTDYWSRDTDFDGASLGASPRQCDVRFSASATATYSGIASLQILGVSSATTTLANQGSGTFALSISGSSLNSQYYQIRNINSEGLKISGSPAITSLDYGDFLLEINGGAMLTVAGTAINANPIKSIYFCKFATSTGISSGYNITATGSASSYWRLYNHFGGYDGEQYDNDPGGDPGYIVWENSATAIIVSGNVYSDEGTTPIGNPPCDGTSQVVRLVAQNGNTYATSCAASDGFYSISGVYYNTGDVLTLYLNTGGGAQAANITKDPGSNISNMHLYQNRVIVRHEGASPLTIANMNMYDADQDSDIPFTAATSSPNTLTVEPDTKLYIWTGKEFAPGGNITLQTGGPSGAVSGSLHIDDNGKFTAAGSESHSVSGNLISDSGAIFTSANSTFTFTATTTGKTINTNNYNFYNLTFNGSAGGWTMQDANATTTYNFIISAGNVILPSGVLAVGNSFTNTGGSFTHSNGTLRMFATASGKQIQAGGSDFYNLIFNGTGGAWTFQDANATTTNNFTIASGSVILPSGALAVGSSFSNTGGSFTHNSGTLRMFAITTGKELKIGASHLYNLIFNGSGGGWNFATGTDYYIDNNFNINNGAVTSTNGTLNIGGDFVNADVFNHNNCTTRFNAASSGKTINPGNSPFNIITFDSASGGWTIAANTTSTNNFNLTSASLFTAASGITIYVSGEFHNYVGGASTTWTGSVLNLNSGSSYTINNKTSGFDTYNNLIIGSGTHIIMWNSAANSYDVSSSGSLYSQDHNNANGSLYIWGNYPKSSGTDYWSRTTDFDGTDISGQPRQCDVRFNANATATYSGTASLQILGASSATTTLANQGAGTYTLSISGSGTFNAQYYQIRNINSDGLNLSGSLTVTSLNYGDYLLEINGGTMLKVASTTIDANAAKQITGCGFSTSTGISSGYNVSRVGTSTNAWNFTGHYGNFDGESYDFDPDADCGYIRWDDSSCLFADQVHYRWRNDNGGESIPPEFWYNGNWTKRKKIILTNNTVFQLTNQQVKILIPYDSDMQTDFDDLRFTDSTGTSSINYYREKYTVSGTSTVWVKVPSVPASGSADIYVYYGNGSVSDASATSTFVFADNFEDGSINEYSGDISMFSATSTAYERSYGLAAASAYKESQTTDGIYRTDISVGQQNTLRFFKYIDTSLGPDDEPCTLFAVQSPGSLNQNYAVCADLYPSDKIVISKDVSSNDESGTILASSSVTWTAGWYEIKTDWLSSGAINTTVYDSSGAQFATVSATNTSYTAGGIGFSFWYEHGAWDFYNVSKYATSSPSYQFKYEEENSGATWKAQEDSSISAPINYDNIRLRFSVKNTGPSVDYNFRLQFASKGEASNCESVPWSNFSDVPVSASCGSSHVCMSTSSYFTDQSSTIQQLSDINSLTFISGRITEDPSNQTNVITLASNYFTEVEYNFHFTFNATESAYCFRANNNETALDNYSKVAEINFQYAPSISDFNLNGGQDIYLNEGTTTLIVATATVSDYNGYADITSVFGKIYRSGAGQSCSLDDNNCYEDISCATSSCSSNSCVATCEYNVWFHADPTDSGSPWEAENYLAWIKVVDNANTSSTATSIGKELYTLLAVEIIPVPQINYGTLEVDQTSDIATSTVKVTGNTGLDNKLSGANMTSGADSISVDRQKYSSSSAFDWETEGINLSGTAACYELSVSKPTSSSTPETESFYWKLKTPASNLPTGNYTGQDYFEAVSEAACP